MYILITYKDEKYNRRRVKEVGAWNTPGYCLVQCSQGPVVTEVVSINFSKHLTHKQSDGPISSTPQAPLHQEEISAERESRFDEGCNLGLFNQTLSSDKREKN